MTITSPIHSFFRADALQEHHLKTPRRIDDPATAARLARELLHSRREDIKLSLYMDDRHRFVGHAIVATGWGEPPACQLTRSFPGHKPVEQLNALSSVTGATGSPAPRK